MTALFQSQLTDDLSDIEVPCSGARAHELWHSPIKSIKRDHYGTCATVPVTTGLPHTTLSAPRKKKPEIAPKPMTHHLPHSTKSVKSAMKALFKDGEESSTDSV